MGSGDLEVFATPSMVALMEHAAMTAVAAALPAGATTVGAEMNVTHIKPSGLGAEITATAVLTQVIQLLVLLWHKDLISGVVNGKITVISKFKQIWKKEFKL